MGSLSQEQSLLGWVYIRVCVQETWCPKHPVMDLTSGIKIGPKLEDKFLKLGVLSWVGAAKIWQKSDATLATRQFFIPWSQTPNVNSLGPNFYSRPMGLLNLSFFGLGS